ncbi:universal stress protein [Actinoplanes sp. NPDC051859]|uniref:universal stress protein n=1 Tax=Actinoplanes sp. NPDC051859 TaxID=3363909 RepID=UPI0037AA7550
MTTGLSATGARSGDAAKTPLDQVRAARPGDIVRIGPQDRPGSAVVAAVDDDGRCGQILRCAAAEAHRRSLPLRVVHVWGARPGARGGARMADADRLLTCSLYDHLPADVAAEAERAILHDDDPVRALTALSAGAALLVVAARSRAGETAEPVGRTARGLLLAAVCPLAVVIPAAPARPVPAPRGAPTHRSPARPGRIQEER